MDIFIEKLVVRKRQGKDYIIAALAVFGALFFSYAAFVLIINFALALLNFIVVIIAVFIFLCVRIISRQNVEFEYSLTNDELDVDKIFARRKRKQLVTVNARSFDIFAPTNNPLFEQEKSSAGLINIYDCSSKSKDAIPYFIVFFNADRKKSLLIFEPNQKMIDGFKRYSPNKVIEL